MSFPVPSSNNVSATNSTTFITLMVAAFNRLLNQLGIFFNYLNGKPQLDSIALTGISLNAGNNTIPHTLGKTLTGWTLTDQTSQADIYRYQPSDRTYFYLNSSATTTVNIVVY